jgi:hypothetical protein
MALLNAAIALRPQLRFVSDGVFPRLSCRDLFQMAFSRDFPVAICFKWRFPATLV